MRSFRTTTNRICRRSIVVMATSAMALGAFGALATPASALVDVGQAHAMETVTCDAARHSVVLTFNSEGLESGDISGGNGYFAAEPRFVALPVYVQISHYAYRTGKWTQDPGFVRVSEGVSTLNYTTWDNTLWYFNFWFQNQQGGWYQRGEYGGGGTGFGYYQWGGYNTMPGVPVRTSGPAERSRSHRKGGTDCVRRVPGRRTTAFTEQTRSAASAPATVVLPTWRRRSRRSTHPSTGARSRIRCTAAVRSTCCSSMVGSAASSWTGTIRPTPDGCGATVASLGCSKCRAPVPRRAAGVTARVRRPPSPHREAADAGV